MWLKPSARDTPLDHPHQIWQAGIAKRDYPSVQEVRWRRDDPIGRLVPAVEFDDVDAQVRKSLPNLHRDHTGLSARVAVRSYHDVQTHVASSGGEVPTNVASPRGAICSADHRDIRLLESSVIDTNGNPDYVRRTY